jgi:hypothetical protein
VLLPPMHVYGVFHALARMNTARIVSVCMVARSGLVLGWACVLLISSVTFAMKFGLDPEGLVILKGSYAWTLTNGAQVRALGCLTS